MRRWTTLAFVLLIVSTAAAREGIVKTKDGRSMTGDVTETDTGVSINMHGVVMNIERDAIVEIEYPESVEAQYQQKLAALEANDAKGRLELARWAFDNESYELARDAAQQALDIDSNSAEAVTLLETIRVQMRMEQNRAEQPTKEPAGNDDEPVSEDQPEPEAADHRVPRRLISNDDVNRIRQLELQPDDSAVRVRFDNDVERRFASASNQEPGRFRNLRPVQKAVQILTEGDADFASDVRVLSDPASMMEFRRLVQPLVLNGCATTGCHGGRTGADPILFSPADDEQVTYTNFYILQQYRKASDQAQGVFGSGERLMIDRANADESLLLQYGLPADISQIDHPPVRGFRAIFRNRQDPRYEQVARWMSESLTQIEPDYGISYTPPVAAPKTDGDAPAGEAEPVATQPATDPEPPTQAE